jgi:hypothetical protein
MCKRPEKEADMFGSNVKRLCAIALASGVLFVGAAAQAEVKKDLSSPKAALTTLANALDQGDKEVAKAAIAGDAQQMKFVDGMVDLMKGMKELQTAAKEKYGSVPDEMPGIDKMLAQVDQAEVKEEGDTATVTMPEEKRPEGAPAPTPEESAASAKARELKLKKVDGDWKLDAATLMQGQELTDEQLQQFNSMSKAASETAKEIKDGKYPDYQTAMQAFGQKMMAAMMGGGMQPQDEGAPAPEGAQPAPAPAPGAGE